MKPPYFEERISKHEVIRVFSPDTDESELEWHWDEEERIVEPLEETDWQFQFDNNLPVNFIINKVINIPAGVIHRVIKGTGKLKVKIII